MILCAVFCGGAIGALVRYLCGVIESKVWASAHYPSDGRGTLCANLIACALVGAFITHYSHGEEGFYGAMLIAGLCGGMSTFSSFALELYDWLGSKRYAKALGMVALTLGLGSLAFALGSAAVSLMLVY